MIKVPSDRVAVVPDKPIDEKAGIMLTEREKPQTGTVVAVGPNCKTVKKDDRVYFPILGGDQIQCDGKTVIVFKEEKQIIAVII